MTALFAGWARNRPREHALNVGGKGAVDQETKMIRAAVSISQSIIPYPLQKSIPTHVPLGIF
jgi:hypothetical protein